MNVKNLAVSLGMSSSDLMVKVISINNKYKLGIEDHNDLTRTQYDIIRAALDLDYMVILMKGDARGGSYNYQHAHDYLDLRKWVDSLNMEGHSTPDLMLQIPPHIERRGAQTLASALRDGGYENRVVMLEETGKQGRRWFKKPEVSFL